VTIIREIGGVQHKHSQRGTESMGKDGLGGQREQNVQGEQGFWVQTIGTRHMLDNINKKGKKLAAIESKRGRW